MNSSEALLLRKKPYGEADYIIQLFTKDFGKISGIAKHAKKSRKRFGGRLEPFIHIRARFKDKSGGLRFIEDVETIRPYHQFIEDLELFLWGSYILEITDALVPEESPNEELFNFLVGTLSELNENKAKMPLVLNYQFKALSLSGYQPNLETCARCGNKTSGEPGFSIKEGGVICTGCLGSKKSAHHVSLELLNDINLMEIHLLKVLEHIKLFTKFIEHHTEKDLNSSKFIEELQL